MTNDALNKKPLALIIEDDPEQAAVFTQALQMAEFETEVIQDGQAALDRLAIIVPALVVLDWQLPYVSGDGILRRIRTDERLAKTRVILATASSVMADLLREKSDFVLIKPISFYQLSHLAARLRPAE
jgi:two-component system phosphate regulon response regulator PhoB